MSFSDLLFYHLLRGNPCHSVKDIHVDKETVVNKLTVKQGVILLAVTSITPCFEGRLVL